MRLTTDNPKGNMETARNLFYIKDRETWVLGGGPEPDYKDMSLYDFVRRITELHGLDIITTDNEAMGEHLCDLLMDNVDTIEGVVALLYTAAWAFSELRERLKAYEDKIPFDWLDEVAALVKARDEGRVVVLPVKTVFEPVWDAGGTCDLRCPERFDGLDTCQGCPKAVPYAHQREYRTEDIIGKTVFLTRAEAEGALGGGGDGL